MRARAAEIAAETGAYQTDQFNNTDMVEGYRGARRASCSSSSTAGSTPSCIYVGTAGCYLGTTRALRDRLPAIHRVAVEPAESAVLSGRPPGTHRIEGGGAGFVPPQLDARRGRRGHRGLDRRRHGDGPSGRPRGRRLVRDRRAARTSPPRWRRAPARRGRPGRHDPGRFRAQVPRRRAVHLSGDRSGPLDWFAATAAARRPDRGDVHRVLRGLLPVTPRSRPRPARSTGRSSGCRCSSSSRSASGGGTARCRARRSGWPRSPGSSSPAT